MADDWRGGTPVPQVPKGAHASFPVAEREEGQVSARPSGREWQDRIEPMLSPEATGPIIAINTKTGAFLLAPSVVRAAKAARARWPGLGRGLYVGRVGSRAVYVLHSPPRGGRRGK